MTTNGGSHATYADSNPFLSRAMAVIRRGRPELPPEQPFFNRIERVPAGLYGEVWFRTSGCHWDRQGGCTMCNYGGAGPVDANAMVGAVRHALESLDRPVDELLVSPSGSLLDPREVPPAARHRIYDLMAAYPAPMILIESRPEWVTQEALAELRNSQPPGRRIAVEIGLESVDPWIRQYCINKGGVLDDFIRAVRLARDTDIEVYANVCLGTAFLTAPEAIDDAVSTVRWALDNGANRAVVFPVHIKPYTLLDVLCARGDYTAPSLWSLVEVLRRLGNEFLPCVEIAWHRSYYDRDDKIRRSPDSCPHCRDTVLRHLDQYRATQAAEVIAALSTFPCACRTHWAEELAAATEGDRAERVAAAYQALAPTFGLEGWLATQGSPILAALRAQSASTLEM